ncbi:MAG TPA: alpha/beta hydrolase, partial [Rhodobacterales bacterium]|nr:alpha/beta hydrolase [Rhodobacterales bacterium]
MTGIISLLHRMFGLRVAVLVTALAMLAQVNPLIAQTLDMGKLAGAVFGSGNQNLVVILHGDGGPGRYDKYAQSVARSVPNTTVVTLTRPGFRGATGASPGQNGGRDHYTRRNNASLAQALAAMRSSLRPRRLIVVGHSGGAAQLATIIATHPGTVDVAILAACPCDVPRWRIHRKGQNNWHQSQSPLDFAARVPRSTRVIAVTFQN